jgi:hypothetical protein
MTKRNITSKNEYCKVICLCAVKNSASNINESHKESLEKPAQVAHFPDLSLEGNN